MRRCFSTLAAAAASSGAPGVRLLAAAGALYLVCVWTAEVRTVGGPIRPPSHLPDERLSVNRSHRCLCHGGANRSSVHCDNEAMFVSWGFCVSVTSFGRSCVVERGVAGEPV